MKSKVLVIITTVVLIAAITIIVSTLSIGQGFDIDPKSDFVNSFEECLAAGNPAMESYPRQCRTPDGKHFVEEILELDLLPKINEPITSANIDERLEITKAFIDSNTFEGATILQTQIDFVSKRVVVTISSEEFSDEFTAEYFEDKLKDWIPFDTRILVARGFAQLDSESSQTSSKVSDLEIIISGEKQIRRGTTHTIDVQVLRDKIPIEDARVFIDIEDYGEDIIKEFDGYTNFQGRFVFSWEIPQSFDDVETLLAIVDVTDNISAKTELFKFQVYCLPGELDCKVDGN